MVYISINNQKKFTGPLSGFELSSLLNYKGAIAIKVNGITKDLSYVIDESSEVAILTSNDSEGIDVIRHSAAHVLARAVKELYKDAQISIGPVINDGFYYDFDCEIHFTPEELDQISNRMNDIISRNEKFERKVVSRAEALEIFRNAKYKLEIMDNIPQEEEISIYINGDFIDLCEGPHIPSSGYIKAFKLTKVSGAYWRGDSSKKMLQRIYGTAWPNQKELNQYLNMLAEAEKRDHRRIGKEMNLFHFQEESPGVPFWHAKGWCLFQLLVSYLRKKQNLYGYQEISTPEIMNQNMWEASGHWEQFREHMFTATASNENKLYAVKPMSCPGCVQVFKHGIVSYKDLPIKLSEFGKVYRYEPSGSLHGLMRVRGFTQDDAHIFCTEEQITEEALKVCNLVLEVYKDCGFDDVRMKFADRPDKRIGSDEAWNKAEVALLKAITSLGVDYQVNSGEGAFYGPKLEFVLKDALGRDWQVGTLQVDFSLPYRLNATYIAEDGKKHHPVMLHRAIFGSIERFIGIMLEHFAGKLPLWLAPVQAVIITINDSVNSYAREVYADAIKVGARVILDDHNETLNYKLRKHLISKVPIVAVIGGREMSNKTISIREERKQTDISLDDFLTKLKNNINNNI